jgi:hypothetical protein
MKKQEPNIKQICLLIPEDWVTELDNLAATRFLSRLGLIRFYLRAQMNEELAHLSEHFNQIDKNKRTHKRIETYLQDQED